MEIEAFIWNMGKQYSGNAFSAFQLMSCKSLRIPFLSLFDNKSNETDMLQWPTSPLVPKRKEGDKKRGAEIENRVYNNKNIKRNKSEGNEVM